MIDAARQEVIIFARLCFLTLRGFSFHACTQGGTLIGTSRCPEMRTREGRKKACWNLVSRGIDRFVCIGGDGSLTGANILRAEWPTFVEEFHKEGKIDAEQAVRHLVQW
jgi:6-phosphofructokinase 1